MTEILEIKPHDEIPENHYEYVKIFLAGTIDNGDSVDWQHEYFERFKEKHLNDEDVKYIVFNPRRDNWDTNPSQEEVEYQINWELDRMEESIFIFMNILPNSKSPISLMELGLFHKKVSVVCPKEFYRYDNVRVVCQRYNIPLHDNIII